MLNFLVTGLTVGLICAVIFSLCLLAVIVGTTSDDGKERLACQGLGGVVMRTDGVDVCVLDLDQVKDQETEDA